MIKEIIGDMVRDCEGVLCHQVNYQGVMGGGIAYAIRKNLLSDEQYRTYQNLCYYNGDSLLGEVVYMGCDKYKTVANMFSQNAAADANENLTNYTAMKICFRKVRAYAETQNLPVFIPGRIGCGIAGGDRERVKEIIYKIFHDTAIDVTIVYLDIAKDQ